MSTTTADTCAINPILTDKRSLELLYESAFPVVKNHILNNNGTTDNALDIFQDAVIAVFEYARMGKLDQSKSVNGFILTIAKNLWINHCKRLKLEDRYMTLQANRLVEFDDGFKLLLDKERENAIALALDKLGKRCKRLLLYSAYFSLSMKEISVKMAFDNENSAKTQKYKCKNKLKEIIQSDSSLKILLDGNVGRER